MGTRGFVISLQGRRDLLELPALRAFLGPHGSPVEGQSPHLNSSSMGMPSSCKMGVMSSARYSQICGMSISMSSAISRISRSLQCRGRPLESSSPPALSWEGPREVPVMSPAQGRVNHIQNLANTSLCPGYPSPSPFVVLLLGERARLHQLAQQDSHVLAGDGAPLQRGLDAVLHKDVERGGAAQFLYTL